MRGLLKAAALLSSLSTSAADVTRSLPIGHVEAPDFLLKYNESEASVVFRVAEPIAPGTAIPPLNFTVGATQNPCGENSILLDGQELSTEWEETHGLGSDFLDAFRFLPNIFTTWHISCLRATSSSDTISPIQVARFGIYNHNKGRTEAAGFAISFRSFPKPEILRYVPVWTEKSDVLAHRDFWRTSSMPVAPQTSQVGIHNKIDEVEADAHGLHEQKSLKAHLEHLQGFLGTTFQKARETFQSWCPTNKQTTLGFSHEDFPSAVHNDPAMTPTTEMPGTHPHAYPTRSATPEAAPTVSSGEESSHHTGLKVFGLILVISSLIIWVVLRLRDPRLRADRAARREERRNKRLYRMAARQHQWKRWFCSWRHRDHRCTPVSTWDEKQARVLEQEEVLEVVMRQDIRKLRRARRARNNISAAEQGQSIYICDSDDSRRRSRETLPGYDSESTQPPSYEADAIGRVTRVADGFRYSPGDREDTPDSSVISTSPRTSRDDRSSVCEKDIEPLNLGTAVSVV
ncbi:MAG: hypothetical protein LQ345_001078 [Seirophora villosa]|nr:MAG: hypothetical protein LQ345_001078 [Seirophora villosa]